MNGDLKKITEKFSAHKIVNLQFGDNKIPDSFEKYGSVVELNPPRVKLEVDRNKISSMLSELLSQYNIEDIGVQDRPLEDVIAEIFITSKNGDEESTKTVSEGVR